MARSTLSIRVLFVLPVFVLLAVWALLVLIALPMIVLRAGLVAHVVLVEDT